MVIVLAILVVEALWTDTHEEESYRNDAAIHMMETGNYSVAYQFGDRYLFKPPGINWAIVLSSLPFGTVTVFSGRIPILLLYLLMPLTIFVLVRHSFSLPASLTAALSSVLYLPWFVEKGPIMEVDLLFTYFVVLSLASWFYFHRLERHRTKWMIGHLALSAAFLIKGPPAFLFFYMTVVVYQLFFSEHQTRWRHVAIGFLGFLIPTGLWFLSTLNQVTPVEWLNVAVKQMSVPATQGTQWTSVLSHLIRFPLETIGSFFPWVLLLLPLTSSSFRKTWNPLWNERPILPFSLAALAVWFIFYPLPASDVRYVLPLFPWLGILSASVLDRRPNSESGEVTWCVGLRRFYACLFLLMAVALPFLLPDEPSLSPLVITGAVLFLITIGAVIEWVSFSPDPFQNLAVTALISILAIKVVFLFVYAPVDAPEWFERETYAASVANYLDEHNLKPCLSTDQNTYFYLHQRYAWVTDCDDDPVPPPSNWVLASNKPDTDRVQLRKTFTHPHMETLYLYRKK